MKSSKNPPTPAGKRPSRKSSSQQPRPTGPTGEEIRFRAYEIYLERGRSDGQDLEDWLQAEKELKGPIRKRASD
jgi:Protein of unknown function (DUF2934)